MRHGFVLAVLLAVAVPAGGRSQDARTDRDKLQGKWDVVAMERDGRSAPREYCQTLVVTFAGDRVTLGRKDGTGPGVEHTFRLDPSKKPKVMDLVVPAGVQKGQLLLGIYAFDGDVLKTCHTDAGARDRPTAFKSPSGSFLSVMVLRRAKK